MAMAIAPLWADVRGAIWGGHRQGEEGGTMGSARHSQVRHGSKTSPTGGDCRIGYGNGGAGGFGAKGAGLAGICGHLCNLYHKCFLRPAGRRATVFSLPFLGRCFHRRVGVQHLLARMLDGRLVIGGRQHVSAWVVYSLMLDAFPS